MEVSLASRNGDAWTKITSWDGDPRAYGDLEALAKRFEVDGSTRVPVPGGDPGPGVAVAIGRGDLHGLVEAVHAAHGS